MHDIYLHPWINYKIIAKEASSLMTSEEDTTQLLNQEDGIPSNSLYIDEEANFSPTRQGLQ
jgi:hypothetical protein